MRQHLFAWLAVLGCVVTFLAPSAQGQSGPVLPATCAPNETYSFTGTTPATPVVCVGPNIWTLRLSMDLLGPATDTTTGNVSTSAHGLMPKLPGGTTTFLRADGTYATPAGGSLPSGLITFVLTGTCPGGFTEVSALNGRTLFGTVAANADVGTTGGADSVTPAGTNTWPAGVPTNSGGTVDAHSATAVADHASHTHTYTQVVNHVHVQNVNSAATGGLSGYGIDTSTNTSTASGYSTANPTGGVATGTTAGPSATLTHSVTQPANHVFTQPTITWPAGVPVFTGTAGENRSAFTRVIFCQAN